MKIKNNKNNKWALFVKSNSQFFFVFLFSFCMMRCHTRIVVDITKTDAIYYFYTTTNCMYMHTCCGRQRWREGSQATNLIVWLFDSSSHNLSPIFERQQLPLFPVHKCGVWANKFIVSELGRESNNVVVLQSSLELPGICKYIHSMYVIQTTNMYI